MLWNCAKNRFNYTGIDYILAISGAIVPDRTLKVNIGWSNPRDTALRILWNLKLRLQWHSIDSVHRQTVRNPNACTQFERYDHYYLADFDFEHNIYKLKDILYVKDQVSKDCYISCSCESETCYYNDIIVQLTIDSFCGEVTYLIPYIMAAMIWIWEMFCTVMSLYF